MEKHQRTHFKDRPDLTKKQEEKKTKEEKIAKESFDGGDFELSAEVSAVDGEIDVTQYLEMSM